MFVLSLNQTRTLFTLARSIYRDRCLVQFHNKMKRIYLVSFYIINNTYIGHGINFFCSCHGPILILGPCLCEMFHYVYYIDSRIVHNICPCLNEYKFER